MKVPAFKTRKEWTALALTVGLVGAGIFLLSQSQKLQRLSVLEEGMGTCFGRVAQTFTARMIGEDRSVYLDKGFTQSTEECFGEAASWASMAAADTGATKAAATANKLANEVTFFHAKIHGTDAQFTKNNDIVQTSHLNTRFQGLEGLREDVLADVAVAKASARTGVLRSKIAFYLFAIACPIAFFMLWWSGREQARTNREVEEEAQSSLESGKATLNATKTLIDRVLANNDLPRTKDLFDRTYALLSLEGKGSLKVRPLTATDEKGREDQIESAWQASEQEVVIPKNLPKALASMVNKDLGPTCDLEAIVTRHLDVLSGRLFTKGIRLDLNIEEGTELRILGKNEDVEQVVFHAINNAIATAEASSREVQVMMKRLGGIAMLQVDVAGTQFTEETLLESAKTNSAKALEEVDLQICRELAKDHAKLSFENTSEGRRIQLVFDVSKIESTSVQDGKRVTNVTKGTKREILAQFNA